MASEKPTTVIKKYANRRLYHMGTSTYVTLEDLAGMVRKGEDFVVTDAKTSEDITRAVLAQIIFEQENKQGQNLLPTAFLRQLIRFYGDSLQALVPRYLEFSMENLTRDQSKLREHMARAFGGPAFPPATFGVIEDQVRANMAFFTDAMRVWSPFPPPPGLESPPAAIETPKEGSDLDDLKRQMADMQEKLAALAKKPAES